MALTKISGSILKDPLNLGEVSIGGTLTYQDVTNVDSLGIGTFRTGINVSGGQLDVGSNIKLGNAGVITATSFVGGLPITSGADNRVLTASSASAIQGEANLVFDGIRLGIGDTPTTQFTSHSILQVGGQCTLGANDALSATGQTYLTHNLYFDTGGTLRVFNTSNANEGAIFRLVDGNLLFSNSAATTGTPTVQERLRVTSGGVVKIGGDVSNAGADVGTVTKLTIKQHTNTHEGGMYIERSGERRGYYMYVGGGLSQNDALSITTNQLGTDTDLVAIDRGGDVIIAGNVGINETSPDTHFHVKTATDSALAKLENSATNGRTQVQYLNPHGDWVQGIIGGVNDGDFITYTSQSKNIRFYTGNSERVRISSNGKTTLGDPSNSFTPIGLLHLYQASNDPYIYIQKGNAGDSAVDIGGIYFRNSTNSLASIYSRSDSIDDGNLIFQTMDNGTLAERLRITKNGHVLPGVNDTYDLGSSSKKWRNIYTTDLQLSNEGKTNDVDGTWGNYTIQEGESDLFLINNRSGKKYKFNLMEVS